MIKPDARICRVLVAGVAVGLSGEVSAQTDPSLAAATPAGETIVVSASWSGDGIPVDQIGSSVTVLDPALLEFRQTRVVSDILRDVPGVAVSRSGGPGSLTQVRIRGSEARHVLVLIDRNRGQRSVPGGVRLCRPARRRRCSRRGAAWPAKLALRLGRDRRRHRISDRDRSRRPGLFGAVQGARSARSTPPSAPRASPAISITRSQGLTRAATAIRPRWAARATSASRAARRRPS